jgi:hypothetical protein
MSQLLKIPKLNCLFRADSFSAALLLCKDAIEGAHTLSLKEWTIPFDGHMRQEEFAHALRELKSGPKDSARDIDAKLDFGNGIIATVYTNERLGKLQYGLRLRLEIEGDNAAAVIAFFRLALETSRFLLGAGCLISVSLVPDVGASAVPDVPIAHVNTRLLVTTGRKVEASYDDPDAFWKAGWELVETLGEQHLLARGLGVASSPDYLAEIIPHQWAMARAAKPGLTKYFLPQVLPEEEAYRAGKPRLRIVGHKAPENVLEFSCVLEPGQHIQGWEIFDLWSVIQEGTLPDERKVETVRVVFLDRWAAEQEKRPLLDIGAKVYYYGDCGELAEFTI